MKIIEAYFATKSALPTQRQCRRDFGKNNVPDRLTIQRLVAKFRETGSVADAPQRRQWSTSFKSFKSFKIQHFQSLDWYLHKMFLVLLYFDKFVFSRSGFCKERAQGHHGGSPKLMFSKCRFLVKDSVLIFWEIPRGVPINSEYSQELCRTMNNIGCCGHLPHFLSSEFGHQTLNCPSSRYIVPAKIFPALPPCQKNWFWGKVRLDDCYPLLRSIASSWIHIGVKRISQACCLHHLKNMGKNSETQLWDEKQNRALFFGPPCMCRYWSRGYDK